MVDSIALADEVPIISSPLSLEKAAYNVYKYIDHFSA